MTGGAGAGYFQCAPNLSEGRDPHVIAALVEAVRGCAGVRVVDWSADVDHHRMVITLIGRGPALVEAALVLAAEAIARIDLTRHSGVHPRLGALDVLPFIPLGSAEMTEAIDLAHEAGRRLGEALSLPVYFYEDAALRPERRNLADVRAGGFERLAAGPLHGELTPDAGPDSVHPTAGAVAVGARERLLAFNVHLRTSDVRKARAIARRVRERDGGLPGVKALGLALASGDRTQVSMNLTRPGVTPLHQAYDAVRQEAAAQGVEVEESELIGALRLEDLLAAARYYLGLPDLRAEQVLDLALTALEAEEKLQHVPS